MVWIKPHKRRCFSPCSNSHCRGALPRQQLEKKLGSGSNEFQVGCLWLCSGELQRPEHGLPFPSRQQQHGPCSNVASPKCHFALFFHMGCCLLWQQHPPEWGAERHADIFRFGGLICMTKHICSEVLNLHPQVSLIWLGKVFSSQLLFYLFTKSDFWETAVCRSWEIA